MNEPAWTFIETLQQPLHQNRPPFWKFRPAGERELSLAGGLDVRQDFPDPQDVLRTMWEDFARFCEIFGLTEDARSGNVATLRIRKAQTDCPEAYRLTVDAGGITLEAADTEGIRRGVVHLEEAIQAAGAPLLPYSREYRKPSIKLRLSRCFFGPIKRPPMNRDELEDDVNYYPDEYLNRLTHEGVNALWLTITFRDTVPVTILPGFGRRAAVHLPKLRKTVERCARYGIRIFVFFIEPTAFIDERDHVRYLDMRDYQHDYPDLLGHRQGNMAGFCPGTDLARAFLREATYSLFSAVPGLGGMIDISIGERFTHCASGFTDAINCPRCSSREPYQVLADVLSSLYQGMHEANPQAEFISWPYSQYILWGDEKTVDAAGRVPHPIILQHNFESSGTVVQLGKTRRADDYWLSYAGPSDLYRRCAEAARHADTRMFAKLQVGCSHEVASVTHVPVPGILYDKYGSMRELGVSGAMQSWYFGNYPSMMTRAAGRLSFEPRQQEKAAFLHALAEPEWGPHSDTAVKAWNHFQEAYEQYPVFHVFGYYAPVHDGPVWPLYLHPADKPLIANWKFMPEFPVHGDRIGECLQDAFTIDEALLLCTRMSRTWHRGLLELESIEAIFEKDPERSKDINTARALDILFASCCNILQFYRLREIMADSTGVRARELLAQMQTLVTREIGNSRALSRCCERDPALGFNSEHEGFRFYPEKLEARAVQLEELLRQDIPALQRRLDDGLLPFPAWTGQEPDREVYRCQAMPDADPASLGSIPWSVLPACSQYSGDGTVPMSFRACYNDAGIYLNIETDGPPRALQIRLFPIRLWPERTYRLDPRNGQMVLQILDNRRPPQIQRQLETSVVQDAGRGCVSTRVFIPFDELERPPECRYHPLRFNLLVDPAKGDGAASNPDKASEHKPPEEAAQLRWVRRERIAFRLAQSPVNPDEYGWLQFT